MNIAWPPTTVEEAEAVERAIRSRYAEASLAEFIPLAWDVLEPGTPYRRGWHIDAMCEHLEAVSRREIKRLVINVPPGYSKSRSVTVAWPCWEWIHRPHIRFMFWSYAQRLSTKHSIERRLVISSDWYREQWGDRFELTADDNQKTQFTNNHRGHMIATSRDGAATGDGGETLVVDDPLNPRQAASEAELENAKDWFKMTLPSRLRDKKNGAIVIVMQRLHEGDTAGLALDMGYEHLCLPAEYDPKRSVHVVGSGDPRKEPGELLWPEHEDREHVDAMKTAMGPYAFSGQYQQSPHPADGGVFKKEWLQYYDPASLSRMSPGLRYATVDLAVSTKEHADYTVIMSWAWIDGSLYLLDMDRRRIEGPDIIPAIRQAMARNQLDRVHIEKAGFQLSLIQQARRENLPVMELIPDKDKLSRAYAAVPMMAAGGVYLPSSAHWLSVLEGELLAFPNAAHDDAADCFVYGILAAPKDFGHAEFKRKPRSAPSMGFARPPGW